MGTVGQHPLGAVFLERLRRLAQRAGGIDHVVHDDAGAPFDFADDVHDFRHIGLRPPLVDDRQIRLQALGQRARAHHAADVGRHHQQILVALLPDVAEEDRRRVHVVDRDIEKALDLVGVQIDGQHALYADRLQHVGDHLGGNRDARRTGPPVLAGVTEIRDGGGDAAGGSALERIHHHHQFHQVVVGRKAGRLQHEDVVAAHMFEDFAADLAVGKTADIGAAKRYVQALDDIGCQLSVGIPGKHHQAVVGHVGQLNRCGRANSSKPLPPASCP